MKAKNTAERKSHDKAGGEKWGKVKIENDESEIMTAE